MFDVEMKHELIILFVLSILLTRRIQQGVATQMQGLEDDIFLSTLGCSALL